MYATRLRLLITKNSTAWKTTTLNGTILTRNLHKSTINAAQISFNLSDIGEGIREVIVKEWFVKPGDKVAEFDNICEVQSDKASVTITSRYEGVIKKLHYDIEEMALVGRPLVDIETESEESSGVETVTTEQNKTEPIPVKSADNRSDILTIPSVRRLAKEHKIDLDRVKATGKNGRILKEDVLKFIENPNKEKQIDSSNTQHQKQPSIVPIKGFQKVMAANMVEALKIPHLVYGEEVSVTKLSEMRRALKSENLKVSYVAFFIKAASNALLEYPIFNSSVDEKCENIIYKPNHNIGVAMDTKVGLAVPVIKNVEQLSVLRINEELERLVNTGRQGQISPNDLQGATFTISNIGAIGGTYMSPIIMPPQVALLAIGATKTALRFSQSNEVVAEEVVNLSTAADHRIIDGATTGRFINLFKKFVENPILLLLK